MCAGSQLHSSFCWKTWDSGATQTQNVPRHCLGSGRALRPLVEVTIRHLTQCPQQARMLCMDTRELIVTARERFSNAGTWYRGRNTDYKDLDQAGQCLWTAFDHDADRSSAWPPGVTGLINDAIRVVDPEYTGYRLSHIFDWNDHFAGSRAMVLSVYDAALALLDNQKGK